MKSKLFRCNSYSLVAICLSIVLLVAIGCSPSSSDKTSPAKAKFVLTVSGSGTTTAVLNGIKSDFEADTEGYRIEIMPGAGTGGGVQGVTEGLLDIAAMARPPKDKEKEAAPSLEYMEFGKTGVAVYAHPSVGVTNLTSQQIIAIFTGKITSWSEVGGPQSGIVLFVRDEEDSSTKSLRSAILGDTPFTKTGRTLTSQGEMQDAVSKTPYSVGIGSWSSALGDGAEVKAIAVDGVAPDNHTYPMVAPLGIGYLADRKADVQPLIDWLLSDQGKQALQKLGVIL